MYIIELISKFYSDFKNKEGFFEKKVNNSEENSTCSHIFVPIDSTKKILACSKCGLVVKVKDENDKK